MTTAPEREEGAGEGTGERRFFGVSFVEDDIEELRRKTGEAIALLYRCRREVCEVEDENRLTTKEVSLTTGKEPDEQVLTANGLRGIVCNSSKVLPLL